MVTMDEYPRVFKFRSDSSPDTVHEARLYENGAVDCTCRGFVHHSKCWHADKVRSGQATNFEHLGKLPLLKRIDIRAALDRCDDEAAIDIVHNLYPSLTLQEAVD